jgi:hypothetical protein
MKFHEVPAAATFVLAEDDKIHLMSAFGDTWCQDEASVWGVAIDVVKSIPRPDGQWPEDMCEVCIADDDDMMEVAEKVWGLEDL